MTDSLVVLIATLLAVAAVFILTGRAKALRREKLRRYCSENGWVFEPLAGRLSSGFRIVSAGWELETRTSSTGRDAGPGSSNVSSRTVWTAKGGGQPFPRFRLGVRLSGDISFGALPDWIKSAMLQEAAGCAEVPLPGGLARRYLLLAEGGVSAGDFLSAQALSRLLDWPAGWPLDARAEPEELRVTLEGRRLDAPDELRRFLDLAQALWEGPGKAAAQADEFISMEGRT